jgi:NarL family two-component system sensor histidine kinase LiaS
MAEDLASHISTRHELAMLEERNRLALELHDSVKQQVFAIAMKLGFTESLADTDTLKKALHDLGELAHQTQDELQRLIHELKPMALEHDDLASALKTYIASWQDLHGLDVTQQIELLEPLSSSVEQALFRVAQESLSNIAKHAQAKHVKLSLSQSGTKTVLNIQDDGCGFNLSEVTSGLGRRSMLERMKQLGGSLDISSKAGEGTELKACLPLEGELA